MIKPKIAILGGGLAGLTAAIHLSRCGIEVCVIEKQAYPYHKVCGEYISKEVLPYLKFLDIPLNDIGYKHIDNLHWSTASGKITKIRLPLGGIGISRYALDNLLYKTAVAAGATVIQDTVTAVSFSKESFTIELKSRESLNFKYVIGAFGKRSSLDKALKRPFIQNRTRWMAVKAHYRNNNFNEQTVQLHNFQGGYCGLSKVETNAVNLCYLTTYDSFKRCGDIETFNHNILSRNKYLNAFLENSELMFDAHLSIAQISFQDKSTVDNHILMIGDSAGLIHPLCGNGMAMAIHSAKLCSELLVSAIGQSWTRAQLEKQYEATWQNTFKPRLRTGAVLQNILLNKTLSKLSISTVAQSPFILKKIIGLTHGKPIQV